MKRFTSLRSGLMALCVALLAVSAFAQMQSGNIYGKVTAKDGSALPGVTVVLTGGGAPQTFITDAQGNFRFISLSPGGYTLKAELAGYGTATRAGITVNVGRNADITLTLNPSVSESITVTAEAPLLDVRKAGTSISISKVELEKIPSSRDPWTVLQQAPSVQVDRNNVGGSQSGQQSVYVAKGASATQNTWNVDGVNITDMGAVGSSPMYFDFDAFEEMQITTGGSDPRVQTPGVQLNMVTKRGTNDIRGSARYFYTPGSYQADATVPSEASGYLAQTNRINFVRDYGVEVGGPIWKDHLWIWAARADNKISNQASQNLSAGVVSGGAFDNIILRDKNAKINGQVTSGNSAVGFYTYGDKVRNARNLSTTRPFEASWRQTGPTTVYKLEDTQIFGSSLYLTGMWSKVKGGFALIPNGGFEPTTNVYRDLAGVYHNSYQEYVTDRPQKQYRLDGSKFFDIGTMNHELKFGFGYRSTPISSTTAWPGPAEGKLLQRSSAYCSARGVTDADACYTMVLTRARNAAYDEKYNDFYAGDTILMGNLTVQAGLRWDRQKSKNTASQSSANPTVGTPLTLGCVGAAAGFCGADGTFTTSLPALSFAGDSKELTWSSVAPRLGLTYALGADKKTLLRAGYNRYIDQLGPTVSGASPLGYVSYAYALGNDANHDNIAQRNELLKWQSFYYFDPSNPTSLTSTTRIDYGMKPPHSDEFIVGFERELLSDFSVGVNYSYRKYSDLITSRAEKHQGQGDWYTRADYEARGTTPTTYTNAYYTETLPSVTFYDLKPGVPAPTYFVITNRDGYSQKFQGLELLATKRLSHNWMLRGNVSFNDWTESCSDAAKADPTPILGNCPGGQVQQRSATSGAFGNVFISSKWSANITGLYQFPWNFNVGASFTARQGYPQPFRVNASEIDPNVVDDKAVLLEPVGDRRFPNVYELDLRVAKDFRMFDRVGVTLSADLFNAPNKRTTLQRETDLTLTNFDYITELQSPRVWRFGAKLTF
jgi:outer membrane receptor protein involved in Fe transport